uniref:RING finger protein 11-like n=1 Tax=Phallusia mammillata TaxID=59560 RepID=A0A6F9DQ95_9ASCI|nr:RING finger protein 11-like [Phallusia mammillata]
MGNQIASDYELNEDEVEVSSQSDGTLSVTNSRDIPQHSRPHHSRNKNSRKHKSHVRLVPLSGSPKTVVSTSLPNMPISRDPGEAANQRMYHLSPGQSCTAEELTEDEQVKLAQRIGFIHHLPRSTWDESNISGKKIRECCICMIDFEQDEPIRYLPCMHYYHLDCIDDWLMRSFTCPTCMEPVDAALLSTYDSPELDNIG